MNHHQLHAPYEILFHESEHALHMEAGHHFFELVYIVSGQGVQCINQNKLAYQPGHLFLITPDDTHALEISTTTKVFRIRFTNIYVKDGPFTNDNLRKLEYILLHANHLPGCILKKQTDKNLVRPVVEALINEHISRDLYNRELIQLLVNTLIVIIARNISESLPDQISDQSERKVLDMLEFIQSNIRDPRKLSSAHLSNEFGVSVSYVGRYFKQQAHETLQEYITRYRLRLIENRLMHSDLRIGEIADELGFSDESHLNKLFKKYKAVTPSAFRKNYKESGSQS
jgi:AraC-like DNA-binding protein